MAPVASFFQKGSIPILVLTSTLPLFSPAGFIRGVGPLRLGPTEIAGFIRSYLGCFLRLSWLLFERRLASVSSHKTCSRGARRSLTSLIATIDRRWRRSRGVALPATCDFSSRNHSAGFFNDAVLVMLLYLVFLSSGNQHLTLPGSTLYSASSFPFFVSPSELSSLVDLLTIWGLRYTLFSRDVPDVSRSKLGDTVSVSPRVETMSPPPKRKTSTR